MTNTIHRKKSRRLLYQELYAMSVNDYEKESFRNSFFADTHTFSPDEAYIETMKKIIKYNEKFFVNLLNIYTPKFNVSNMSLSYILPIYIALGEMFFLDEEIPWKVSINEAIELSKTFWDDSAKKIVNWVLNKVFHDYDELEKTKENNYENITESIFKK